MPDVVDDLWVAWAAEHEAIDVILDEGHDVVGSRAVYRVGFVAPNGVLPGDRIITHEGALNYMKDWFKVAEEKDPVLWERSKDWAPTDERTVLVKRQIEV